MRLWHRWRSLNNLGTSLVTGVGLRFGLLLPILAVSFWLFGKAITYQMLSRASDSQLQFDVKTQVYARSQTNILYIKADIQKTQGISLVKVKLANSTLRELEFEFPVIEPSQIEQAIAHELGLSLPDIRGRVRYRIDSDR